MTLRAAIILLTLLGAAMLSPARQPPDTSSKSRPAARNDAAAATDAQNQNDRNDQTEALRSDLTRMRALVQQMETNLAFVDTTQSPLKHQFQLEIDMWKIVINQMERRLQPQGHTNQVK